MKFKKTGGRVPRFVQIVLNSEIGELFGLAGEAGGDTGSVWVYIPDEDGWVKLGRDVLEEDDSN